jgi:hypothetical protein
MSIVGQNTLLNQYVPTFFIKNIQQGQTLVYDSVRKAFINAEQNSNTTILDVPSGGTGNDYFEPNQILFGKGTLPLQTDPALAFIPDGLNGTLFIGGLNGARLATDTLGVTLSSIAPNYSITLIPNGNGSVIIGTTGGGILESAAAESLEVVGNTTLTLTSILGSLYLSLPAGITNKLSIIGPTAVDYATGLAENDLTNKFYVDNAITTGAAAGAVKSLQTEVPLNVDGTTVIGTFIPTNSTLLSVKVLVDVPDTTATLCVGSVTDGIDAFMLTTENDLQTAGIYEADIFFTIGASEQVIATVAGSSGSGLCHIIYSYQVPQ